MPKSRCETAEKCTAAKPAIQKNRVFAYAGYAIRVLRVSLYLILTYISKKTEKSDADLAFVLYDVGMKLPLFICNGVLRSGSTWSYNVCRGLAQELANQRGLKPVESTYLDLAQMESYLTTHWQSAVGPIVLKSHEPGPVALSMIRAGRIKAVCTFRDPRDCVSSDLKFMGLGFDKVLHRVRCSFDALRLYQTTDHILLIRYEDMVKDPQRQIRRIAMHLGIDANADVVSRIHGETNIETSRKICDDVRRRPDSEVYLIAEARVDPATRLHENHVFDGKVGRWRSDFTAEQGRWLTEYFSNWLIQLGYETPQSISAATSRAIGGSMFVGPSSSNVYQANRGAVGFAVKS